MQYPIKKPIKFYTGPVIWEAPPTYDLDKVKEYVRDDKRIALIKDLRLISGLGLKESKDLIEQHITNLTNGGNVHYDTNNIIKVFSQYLDVPPNPYTKEEFLNLIENSIDVMETFHFTNMIEAVEVLLKNVKKEGGLEALAKKRDQFFDNL